jgi:hypothetical protein
MYRFILSVTMVVSLAAASGCGAHAARHSATPAGSNVADVSNDPSWCPPGEDFQIGDARGATTSTPKKHDDASHIHPNAAKRPTTGAVHAALY